MKEEEVDRISEGSKPRPLCGELQAILPEGDGRGSAAGLGREDTSSATTLALSALSAWPSLPQTRDALLKILEDIKEEDFLNFILFSGGVTTWKDHLVQATPENLEEARIFVRNIRDQGSKQMLPCWFLPSVQIACFPQD